MGPDSSPAGHHTRQAGPVSGTPPIIRLLVLPSREGARLDVFIPETVGISRRRSRSLIAQGAVWRNGQPIRVQSRTLEYGDVIDILDADFKPDPPPWRPEHLELIFEDRWIAVANKKAGVLTQPSENSRREELALDQHLLLWMAYRDGQRPFLRTVHRLDRLTSGLVVFAHNPQALPALDRSWRSGRVERLYLALVEGHPNEDRGVIDAPIGRDRSHAWRFKEDRRGKAATTRFRVIQRADHWSAVVCRLETGRTHQVRVHLAHLGHPVLGDHLYGSTNREAPRPLLHAWALAFPHPSDKSPLRLTAPIPSVMTTILGENAPADPWNLPQTGRNTLESE